MRRAVVALLTLGIGCAAPARTVPTPAAAAPAIGAVTAEELRRDLYAFAHDSMHGRETGTDDATRAMRFLVDRLTQLGLEPAGDSGFAQRVPMQKEVFGPETRIAVEEGGVIRSVKIGTEIVPLLNLGAGVPPTKRTADGEIVFVGYGLTLANPKRDDFAGLSLQGKVVVVVNGAPAGVDSAKRAELEGQGAISQRLAQILPQRPAAVIILLDGERDRAVRAVGAADRAWGRTAQQRAGSARKRTSDPDDHARRAGGRLTTAADRVAGGRQGAGADRQAAHGARRAGEDAVHRVQRGGGGARERSHAQPRRTWRTARTTITSGSCVRRRATRSRTARTTTARGAWRCSRSRG